jgi:hypothetical protein
MTGLSCSRHVAGMAARMRIQQYGAACAPDVS